MATGTQERVHHLGRDAIHTCWNADLPPRLTVAPGDTVTFQTLEPSWGRVARDAAAGAILDATPETLALAVASAYPEAPKGAGTELSGHALTGPLAVEGAEPGDTLVVEVLDVSPAAWGWTHCGPDGGLLANELSEHVLYLWDLRDRSTALFLPGIRVPLAPFCGVMGVAPAAPGPHSTIQPRQVGGNMDVRQLTAGATLFLPVEVPGALFSVGDAHAAQGDGEVAGTGIETDASVTLRFHLRRDEHLAAPRLLTPSPSMATGPAFAAAGSHTDLLEAARQALRGVLTYLEEHHALTRPQSLILASACVDLRINQVVNGRTYTVTAFLPFSIFDSNN